MTAVPAPPPGLDPERLAAHLAGALPAADAPVGPLRAELIAGGRSNLTYRVTDGRSRWVVRRPPLGHVLPTAHDMAREYRVIRALASSAVPVPPVLLLCTDADVLGAPFYLMTEVPGLVLRTAAEHRVLLAAGPGTAGRLADAMIDVLVALHRIDPAEIGLGDFGRPDGYLTRQVSRWYRQWQASVTEPLPALDELHGRLAGAVPETERHTIVHGDYRLDNVMFDGELRRVVAVLDWEMATLGDPLADLGLLNVYTELGRHGLAPAAVPPPAEAGFPSGPELLARYAAVSGTRLHRIGWYTALGYYKLAIISAGIHARYLAGETVGADFDTIGARVPTLVGLGLDAVRSGEG